MKLMVPCMTLLALLSGADSSRAQSSSTPPTESHPDETPVTSLSFGLSVTLPGSPEEVYDGITGDVSDWWDHRFSETPHSFVLEARPGGRFLEVFDESGDGVLHATVIYAHRGTRLRFAGPFGFSGRPVHSVITYEFEALASDTTRLEVDVRTTGALESAEREALRRVWHHFIVDRFKPYWEESRLD